MGGRFPAVDGVPGATSSVVLTRWASLSGGVAARSCKEGRRRRGTCHEIAPARAHGGEARLSSLRCSGQCAAQLSEPLSSVRRLAVRALGPDRLSLAAAPVDEFEER